MTPTTNQVLARLVLGSDSTIQKLAAFHIACDNPVQWGLDEFEALYSAGQPYDHLSFIQRLAQPQIFVPVWLEPSTTTKLPEAIRKDIQIPIEPSDSSSEQYVDDLLLCAWLMAPNKQLQLTPHRGASNLLWQAKFAKIELDVLLAFELSGLTAPKNYENWRLPDGNQCPERAMCKSLPSLGEVEVFYHNGQYALVIGGECHNRAEIIHVASLESTIVAEIGGFIRTNTAKKPRKGGHGVELTKAEILAEAEKWL